MDSVLARRLHEGGEMIAAGARMLSGWSHRIPASVHVEDAFNINSVFIIAGGEVAPHAITFEAPNARYWRHPVFARGPREKWHWAPQIPPRRFLKPAAEQEAGDAVTIVAQAVNDWAKFLGYDET